METDKKSKKGSIFKIIKHIILVLFLLFIICCDIVVYLLYGPWNGFRDWVITTAMDTFHHQYIATLLYPEETIQNCLNRNKVIQVTGYTDESLIQIINYSQKNVTSYANEYERQILEKDKNNNDYKIIEIDEGSKYSGYMAVIYDPSRIKVVAEHAPDNPNACRRVPLLDISQETNALVAINAGGFGYVTKDEATLAGLTISNNKVMADSPVSSIIGFNKRNKLILGNFSTEEAVTSDIRDCVSFDPYLIMNGQKSQVLGNGGAGKAPRTAIGQRADGIVLFLALDGNRVLGQGADMQDLIDIFEKYGAINAANLDGGNSTTMTVRGQLANDPIGKNGNSDIRPVPSAFILVPDDSDDGDYSVLKDRIK